MQHEAYSTILYLRLQREHKVLYTIPVPGRQFIATEVSRMTIQDDGIRLDAVLEVPEGHDGHRLVIQLHGFTGTKDRPHNIRAAAAMRDAGFATLRFDLYGHGESGGEFRNHTLFKWISNTMAVIHWAPEGWSR